MVVSLRSLHMKTLFEIIYCSNIGRWTRAFAGYLVATWQKCNVMLLNNSEKNISFRRRKAIKISAYNQVFVEALNYLEILQYTGDFQQPCCIHQAHQPEKWRMTSDEKQTFINLCTWIIYDLRAPLRQIWRTYSRIIKVNKNNESTTSTTIHNVHLISPSFLPFLYILVHFFLH